MVQQIMMLGAKTDGLSLSLDLYRGRGEVTLKSCPLRTNSQKLFSDLHMTHPHLHTTHTDTPPDTHTHPKLKNINAPNRHLHPNKGVNERFWFCGSRRAMGCGHRLS